VGGLSVGVERLSSVQKTQPGGADGHDGSGCQPGGGVHPAGVGGHPGGVL